MKDKVMKSETSLKSAGVCLFGAALAFGAQGAFVWQNDLVLEKADAPVTLGTAYKNAVNSSMTLHGNLEILMSSLSDLYYVNATNAAGERLTTAVPIALGPDSGDDATLTLRKVKLETLVSNYGRAEVTIGKNGGNGRLCLNYVNDSKTLYDYATARIKSLILSENAQTSGDVFDVLTIGTYSEVAISSICNLNVKPMRVKFFNNDQGAYDRKQRCHIYATYNAKLFSLPAAGGDIVLAGGPLAPVCLYEWYGNGYSLFDGTPVANLVFEGPCDVEMEVGGAASVKMNGSNIKWKNTGDLRLYNHSSGTSWTVDVTAANCLPYGSQTGRVRVEKVTVDLKGNGQRVNGVTVSDGGSFTSTGSVAPISVGDENGNGFLSGVLTDETVSWTKNGADGVLVLSNATVHTLCVTGGIVRLAPNSVNAIGRLAITNAYVELSETAKLDVTTWEKGPDVRFGYILQTVGGVSNEVATVCPTASGATLYKDGDYLIHCVTPVDAHGMEVNVSGGALKMGGEATANRYWRMTYKKAMVPLKTYAVPADGYSQDVNLLLGGFALFSTDGFHALPGMVTRDPDGTAASALQAGHVSSERGTYSMSTDVYKGLYPQTVRTTDPICSGGSANEGVRAILQVGNNRLGTNSWDVIDTTGNPGWFNWSQGTIYTNGELKADVPATWERMVWRLSDGTKSCSAYAMARFVNTNGKDCPHPTDWMLESSPDGVNWQTMDERSGQDFTTAIHSQFNYTYNNHIPYLFTARRANWRFDTFGPVSVAAGATLDLSEIPAANIAIAGLRVDLTAGAGTIKRFVPAANGVLHLTGLRPADIADGGLKTRIELPLTLTDMQETARLESWTVVVNGVPATGSMVSVRDGKLFVLTPHGTMVIFR